MGARDSQRPPHPSEALANSLIRQHRCGGVATEPSDSTVDLTVDQFAVSIRSSHPEGHWSFNIANSTSPPFNWTSITNIVETQGVGDFCLPALSIPAEYAGSSGVLQIIDNASDGMLYQVCCSLSWKCYLSDQLYSARQSILSRAQTVP